ncbi:response regulator [Gemmatimonas aurantiaca]|nr:response regulator [Gemmatimonas aurantiaca]
MNRTTQILVADDEEIVVSLVRDCLESEGHTVIVAMSGTEAEARLREQRFDLLITDIRMPDFDGIELLRRAKKHQADIGAIFMTGYANVQSAKDAIKEGALDYLMKPFEIDEIRTAVRNALEKLSASGDGRAEAELDRMTRVTRLMNTVGDLNSLMQTALSAALAQSNLPCGSAVFYSPSDDALIRIESTDSSGDNFTTSSIPLTENPFAQLKQQFPEIDSESFVTKNLADHPLAKSLMTQNIQTFMCDKSLCEGQRLVSFVIGRNDKVFGFLCIPIETEQLSEMGDKFKYVSLTAQQTALSVENLLLLRETQEAYQQLQSLQAKSVALETMAAKGEFAAEIGHELKNFLGIVYGNYSLLEQKLSSQASSQADSPNAGLSKYFDAINSNLEKMKRFASDLMRESPLEGTKELIDVNARLNDLANFMRPQQRFNGVTLKIDTPEETIQLEIDPLLFQQLIYNLANNAADACKDCREPLVEITLTHTNQSHTKLTIVISDNGTGIDPELLKKTFSTRFTTKSDGNGFGLVVCRKIIDSHQGILNIESEVGRGTTISIEFPVGTVNAHEISQESSTVKIVTSEVARN